MIFKGTWWLCAKETGVHLYIDEYFDTKYCSDK